MGFAVAGTGDRNGKILCGFGTRDFTSKYRVSYKISNFCLYVPYFPSNCPNNYFFSFLFFFLSQKVYPDFSLNSYNRLPNRFCFRDFVVGFSPKIRYFFSCCPDFPSDFRSISSYASSKVVC